MKKSQFSLSFFILSIFCLSAQAQSITKVVENSEASFYVKNDTIKRAGNSVDFWQVTDFKQAKFNKKGEAYFSMDQHLVIDCSSNTQTLIYVKVYGSNMLSGSLIASGSLNQKNPIPYGSSLEVVRNSVCR